MRAIHASVHVAPVVRACMCACVCVCIMCVKEIFMHESLEVGGGGGFAIVFSRGCLYSHIIIIK